VRTREPLVSFGAKVFSRARANAGRASAVFPVIEDPKLKTLMKANNNSNIVQYYYAIKPTVKAPPP